MPCRSGFVLPLALLALTVLVIMAGALVEGGVHDVRLARDTSVGAAAELRLEGATAELLAVPPDSAVLSAPPGSVWRSETVTATDTVRTTLHSLGGSYVRAVLEVRFRSGARWAATGAILILRIAPDTAAAGALRLRRIPGRWWTPNP